MASAPIRTRPLGLIGDGTRGIGRRELNDVAVLVGPIVGVIVGVWDGEDVGGGGSSALSTSPAAFSTLRWSSAVVQVEPGQSASASHAVAALLQVPVMSKPLAESP